MKLMRVHFQNEIETLWDINLISGDVEFIHALAVILASVLLLAAL